MSITTKCISPYNHSGLQLTIRGSDYKGLYNQMYQSLQPLWLQLTNLEGMITIIPYVPVTTTILPIAYQIWADGFKRCR